MTVGAALAKRADRVGSQPDDRDGTPNFGKGCRSTFYARGMAGSWLTFKVDEVADRFVCSGCGATRDRSHTFADMEWMQSHAKECDGAVE